MLLGTVRSRSCRGCRRISNRPRYPGCFSSRWPVGNLLRQEEEGHRQRVDHDRGDPGGRRPHPRRLRQHQPSVPRASLSARAIRHWRAPIRHAPQPPGLESATNGLWDGRSSALANWNGSVSDPIIPLIPLSSNTCDFEITIRSSLLGHRGKSTRCVLSADARSVGGPSNCLLTPFRVIWRLSFGRWE
jgi:hypothetical protein